MPRLDCRLPASPSLVVDLIPQVIRKELLDNHPSLPNALLSVRTMYFNVLSNGYGHALRLDDFSRFSGAPHEGTTTAATVHSLGSRYKSSMRCPNFWLFPQFSSKKGKDKDPTGLSHVSSSERTLKSTSKPIESFCLLQKASNSSSPLHRVWPPGLSPARSSTLSLFTPCAIAFARLDSDFLECKRFAPSRPAATLSRAQCEGKVRLRMRIHQTG